MLHSRAEPVCIVKTDGTQGIEKAVKEGLDSVGDLELGPGRSVVIKPNLCAIKSHETGATTDPRVVEAIVRYLKDEYDVSEIFIVESDGTQVLADMAFKLLGYEPISERLNVNLVNLSKSPFSVKLFPGNRFLKKVRIPRVLETAGLFISVPKIKTHDECTFTGALKNQFGCNPYPRKSVYHKRLHDAIVDLNVAYKPDLVIVDGIVAMEGGSCISGIPVKMNTLIFGKDAVATDHLIARLMGLDPNKVDYLIQATSRVGNGNYETIGKIPEEVERKFRGKPRMKWYNLYGLLHRASED